MKVFSHFKKPIKFLQALKKFEPKEGKNKKKFGILFLVISILCLFPVIGGIIEASVYYNRHLRLDSKLLHELLGVITALILSLVFYRLSRKYLKIKLPIKQVETLLDENLDS